LIESLQNSKKKMSKRLDDGTIGIFLGSIAVYLIEIPPI
jgi:hypothetical protein